MFIGYKWRRKNWIQSFPLILIFSDAKVHIIVRYREWPDQLLVSLSLSFHEFTLFVFYTFHNGAKQIMGHQTQLFRLCPKRKTNPMKNLFIWKLDTNIGTKPPNLIEANFQLSRTTRENKVQNKTDPSPQKSRRNLVKSLFVFSFCHH